MVHYKDEYAGTIDLLCSVPKSLPINLMKNNIVIH